MKRPASAHYPPRAPRVTLPECVFAIVQLENNRQIPAKLQRISITGGLLDLAVYVEERVSFTLKLPIGSGVVNARAEMLFPMRGVTGYLQPFRITAIRPEQLHILEREINEILRQAPTPAGAKPGIGVHPPNFLLESL